MTAVLPPPSMANRLDRFKLFDGLEYGSYNPKNQDDVSPAIKASHLTEDLAPE